jgi:drug/metabolite transporter (DMT)-like permease
MTLTAIVLLVIAAILHASWNTLGKHRHPSLAFFFVANIAATIMLIPILVMHIHLISNIPQSVWILLLFAGLSQAVYYMGLANAYRLGDMSLAYPLARSSPVLILLVATFILGKSNEIGIGCVLGIILIVGGSFLLPMRHLRDIHLANYLNPVYLLALVAAIGTTGYTLIDDAALEILRQTRHNEFTPFGAALIYLVFEAGTSSLFIGLMVLMQPNERRALSLVFKTQFKMNVLTGMIIYVTYGLVLWSMAYADNVSYIAAFRQLSIPLGVLMGVGILKEPKTQPKLVGTCSIFIGLILVALY